MMTGNSFDSDKSTSFRHYWLDLARAVAIISVIMNHALSRSFLTRNGSGTEFLEMTTVGSLLKAFLYVFSRIGVPLFLMITGSLLMDRNYEDKRILKRFYRHNWGSLLITTEIWLFIMYWFLQFFEGSFLHTQGLIIAVAKCFTTLCFINPTTLPNMWYMWMILLVYLMIPIMAVGIKRLGDKPFYVLISIAVIVGMVFPNLNSILYGMGKSTRLDYVFSVSDLFSIYFVYVFIGYWISVGKLQRLGNVPLIAISVFSLVSTTVFQYWMYSSNSNQYVVYDNIGILLSSTGLFEIFRRCAPSLARLKRPVTYLAKSAFAVFFLHLCIMHVMNTFISKEVINRFPRFFLLGACSLVGSLIFVGVFSRILFVRQRVFLIKDPE